MPGSFLFRRMRSVFSRFDRQIATPVDASALDLLLTGATIPLIKICASGVPGLHDRSSLQFLCSEDFSAAWAAL
jgi:hypothetical protein